MIIILFLKSQGFLVGKLSPLDMVYGRLIVNGILIEESTERFLKTNLQGSTMGATAAGGVGFGDTEEVGGAQERHLQDGHTGSCRKQL